jgi:hypothetical protein
MKDKGALAYLRVTENSINSWKEFAGGAFPLACSYFVVIYRWMIDPFIFDF